MGLSYSEMKKAIKDSVSGWDYRTLGIIYHFLVGLDAISEKKESSNCLAKQYKEQTERMLENINDEHDLQQIYTIVHRKYIKGTAQDEQAH